MADARPDIRAVFCEALDRKSPEELSQYLDAACGGDAELRAQVEELLASHREGGKFLGGASPSRCETLDRPLTEGPGAQIGPYKLLQEIGLGGMGVVYMAEQTAPVRRKVALKIIKPGMDTRQVIARFEAERQALSLMDHPNIARVLDAGTTESGRPYFVMELVKGQPITQYCDEHQLTPRERLEMLLPVCQAIQHAHQKGIIHRDVKPSNILVAEYDEQAVPKVIDFGVAKAISQPLTEKTMFTGFGQIVGTIEYMSPEQAKANQLDIDTRSDIYSLGVLMYELLTGTTPLDKQRLRSAAWDEMLRIIREEEPPRPSTRLSESKDSLPSVSAQRQTEPAKLTKLVRGELDWIVMKALEKDRARRYETANGLANDIHRYLNDEPVTACPPSAAYRFKKFARRNKGLLATAATITAVLLLGAVISTWQAIRANRAAVAERQAHEETERAWEAEARQRSLAEQQRDRAEKNLELANTEQQRAEGNLDLALKALDAVYLDAIGTEKLLGEPVAKRGEADSVITGRSPLSALERELLKRGLAFYDQFAEQNAATPRAFVQTAQAHYRVGLLQAALGDGTRAAEAYREAIRRFERLNNEEPNNAKHFRQLADAYRGLANAVPDWDTAKKFLESSRVACSKAIELQPKDATLYAMRASVLQALGDPRVVDDLERVVQLDTLNVEAILSCAKYYRSGHVRVVDWQKARHYAELAVALAPDNPLCHIELADVLGAVDLGDPGPRVNAAAALEHYARAIQLAPNLHFAYRERGRFYFYIGDNRHALTDLNRALELKPDDYSVLRSRARVFTGLGEFDKALADLALFAKFWPHEWYVHDDIGRIHLRRNNWQAAVDAFTKSLEINPSGWHVFVRRAQAFVNLGHHAQALADLRRALELKPEAFTLSWSSIVGPQLAAAPEEFRQGLLELARDAIERAPQPAQAYVARGALYCQMKDHDKAIQDYSKALEIDPKSKSAYLNRGLLYQVLGEYDKVRDDWQKALELAPQDPEINNNIAWFFVASPDSKVWNPQRAVALAKQAVELQPENASHWNTLGVAQYRTGDRSAAVATLHKSIELGKGSSYDYFFLAMAHWQLGEKDEARQWYDKGVVWMDENKPDDEELIRFRAEASELLGVGSDVKHKQGAEVPASTSEQARSGPAGKESPVPEPPPAAAEQPLEKQEKNN